MCAQLIHLHLFGSSGVCLIMILQQGKLKPGGENCKVTENEEKEIPGLTCNNPRRSI